jgi:hypothetical protein
MAGKAFKILLNLSLIFVVIYLKEFEACSGNLQITHGREKPNVNCIELAAEMNVNWRTLNCEFLIKLIFILATVSIQLFNINFPTLFRSAT